MFKSLKLGNAEVKKIFSRPSILIVFLLIAVIVAFSRVLFTPVPEITKVNYSGAQVQTIYSQFITNNIKSDDNSSTALNSAKTSIESTLNAEDKLGTFTNLIENCYFYFSKNMESPVRKTITQLGNDSASIEDAKKILIELKNNKVYPIYSYIVSSLDSNVNFYLTHETYNDLKTYFDTFYKTIPNNFTGYGKKEFIQRYNTLLENFSFEENVFPITSTFEKFEINKTYFSDTITQKYINETQSKLNVKLQEIETFYLEHASETSDSYKEQINELISQYCSTAKVATQVIDSEIKLAKAGNKSDAYLQTCIDFKNFRRYELTENLNINKYLIDNNMYEYNILRNFNFNKTSGYKENMFDFAFFALQIASIIITLFLVFSISAIIADEQNKGTIKLVAIRPISRNKILSGKFIGAISSSIILLLITMAGALIFGFMSFGLPTTTSVILSVNAGSAFSMNVYLLFLIYIVNIIINLLLIGSIALFFACLTRSNVITIFVSSALYILSISLSNVFNSATWTKFLPIANLDLIKFFGNTSQGFLTLGIPPDPTMLISILSVGITIIVLNLISHMIFASRDLA